MVENDVEIKEEEQQEEIREPQPEDKPKKKKVLSEKQLKVLADGREKARLRREEINREAYLKNKTKLLQEAKEIKKFQQKEQTKKIEADFDANLDITILLRRMRMHGFCLDYLLDPNILRTFTDLCHEKPLRYISTRSVFWR